MNQLNSYIDHTLLKPDATLKQILGVALETEVHNFASLCIPPAYVKICAKEFPTVNICTVIGFPLGYNHTKSKLKECKQAVKDGASELDVVVNAGLVKSEEFDKVEKEMRLLTNYAHDHDKTIKWIFETSLLTQDEIVKLCKLCNKVKPDYAKTSTGFGKYGARIEDVTLMKSTLDANIKIKASGGIRTYEDAIKYINLGVSRIGTSSGIKIVSDSID